MDQPLQTQPVPPTSGDTGQNAKIVYIMYLVSLLVGVTSLVGVIMAYVYQGEAPEWIKSHYRLQIRTFWIGLLYAGVSLILTTVVIGILGFLFVAVWMIVRCVKGLQAIEKHQPYANPATWLW